MKPEKRGRPRDPQARRAGLHTRVSEAEEQEIARLAKARRVSVAELLRKCLAAARQGLV